MNLCERHIGEEFPPRCPDCNLEALQAANQVVRARLDRNPPQLVRPVYTSQSATWAAPAIDPEILLELDMPEEWA
jgi:hypothetical protein